MLGSIGAPTGRALLGGCSSRSRDGRLRPLGVAVLEDKIVQRALVEVLNAVYEEDFLGFSYGFRPGVHRTARYEPRSLVACEVHRAPDRGS